MTVTRPDATPGIDPGIFGMGNVTVVDAATVASFAPVGDRVTGHGVPVALERKLAISRPVSWTVTGSMVSLE